MTNSSRISVIIPTKDRLHFLKNAIPMYLRRPEVKEVIVIIDGSTDGTREFLELSAIKDRRIKIIDNITNMGIPISRNKGINVANGEFIFSAEDDLEITDGFFDTLISHMQDSKIDIISGRNIFRHEYETAEQAIGRTNGLKIEPVNKKTIEINTSVQIPDDREQLMIASPMLGRTETFRDIQFDENLKVNYWREETDFQISAIEKGYKLYSCPHAICFNYIIEGDRSGVHAAIGLKRVTWIVRNNWYFINKHAKFISSHFTIGNKYAYITKFALVKIVSEVILPILGRFAKKLKLR